MRHETAWALAIALGGCGAGSDGRGGSAGGPGIGSLGEEGGSDDDAADEAGGGDADGDAGADDDGGGDDGPNLFDVGASDPDGLPEVETGCDKIDFLFVIDNSGTMKDYQQELVASFPGFIEEIESVTDGGHDVHVMVADTDEWGRCNTANGWVGLDPQDETCNAYIESTVFEECDRVRGAGVVHPAGVAASNTPCAPFGGNRYMISGDPDPAGTFACMAKVGTAGHQWELVMDSARAALSPPLVDAGGCNEGFLRDDALLVLVIIADEADGPGDVDGMTSSGTPADWYADIVARKSSPDDIVVVSLVHDPGGVCPPPQVAMDGSNITELTHMFGDHGFVGGICEASYAPVFAEAVSIIDAACDEFEPPG